MRLRTLQPRTSVRGLLKPIRPGTNRKSRQRDLRTHRAKADLLVRKARAKVKAKATADPIIAPTNVGGVDPAADLVEIAAQIVAETEETAAIAGKADVPAVDVLSMDPPTSSSKS